MPEQFDVGALIESSCLRYLITRKSGDEMFGKLVAVNRGEWREPFTFAGEEQIHLHSGTWTQVGSETATPVEPSGPFAELLKLRLPE